MKDLDVDGISEFLDVRLNLPFSLPLRDGSCDIGVLADDTK